MSRSPRADRAASRRSSRRTPHALARTTLVVALACSVLVSPATALATRYDSDAIAGIPLSECDPSKSIAPSISAAAGVICTADGQVLWSREATTPRAMASTTKIMTALIAIERAGLDEQVVVSEAASKVDYAIGLEPGERRSVGELLELALVASSNDAAYALAEHVSGSIPAFVDEMNERADELKLRDTRFANPHGLDQANHHSSAADLSALARAAMGDPTFRRIVGLSSVTLPAHGKRKARTIESTDELLDSYPGLLGGKTGFTDDAKYSFVASARRDGVSLTAVVLGAPSSSVRFKHSARLLDWGFEHLKVQTVATATETVGAVPVAVDTRRTVPVRVAETTSTAVFDLAGPVARRLVAKDRIDLPVFAGQALGRVEVVQGERVLATVPAVAAADIASVNETVGAVPVRDYLDVAVTARAAETSVAVPAFDQRVPVRRDVQLDRHVSAPVEAGDPLGEITYSQAGRVLVTVPVVAASDVVAPGLMTRLGTWLARGWRTVTGSPTMAQLVIVET